MKEEDGQKQCESWEDDQARSEVHHPDTAAQGQVSDVPCLNVKTLQDTFVLL